jgi:hypothetical protein
MSAAGYDVIVADLATTGSTAHPISLFDPRPDFGASPEALSEVSP